MNTKPASGMTPTQCWVCGMPRKRINSHPIFCVACQKDHDVCPTCHPDLVKARIIFLPSMTGRWPVTAFRTQGIYEQACLSKEMLAASRLMGSE